MSVTKGHIALRRCRVCRQQRPKSELMRWTKPDGMLKRDPTQQDTGRGIYTCSDTCAERLPKIKGLK